MIESVLLTARENHIDLGIGTAAEAALEEEVADIDPEGRMTTTRTTHTATAKIKTILNQKMNEMRTLK